MCPVILWSSPSESSCWAVHLCCRRAGWMSFPFAHRDRAQRDVLFPSTDWTLRLSWLHKENVRGLSFFLGSTCFVFQAAWHLKYHSHLNSGQILQVAMLQVARFLKAPREKLMHQIPPVIVLQPFGGLSQLQHWEHSCLQQRRWPKNCFVVVSAEERQELTSFPVMKCLGFFYDLHTLLLQSCTVCAAWLQETEDLFWLAKRTFAVSLYNFTIWLVNSLPLLRITSDLISWVQTSFIAVWIRLLIEYIYQ